MHEPRFHRITLRAFASALCLAGLIASETASGATRASVFVLDVESEDLDEDLAKRLTLKIAELVAARAVDVLTRADVEEVLSIDKTRELMGCGDRADCLVEIREVSEADQILSATAGRVGESFVLTLSLVDAKRAVPLGRATETAASPEALFSVVPSLIDVLYGGPAADAEPVSVFADGRKVSFAVLDLEPAGIPENVAKSLTEVLSVEIKRAEGASVIGRDDLAAVLKMEQMRQLLGADCDTACFAEIGGALGVDKLVVGSAGKLGEHYVISLRLIDQGSVKVDHRVSESFKGTEGELLRAVRHAARRLLGIADSPAGALAVTASEEAAEVFVDGERVGRLPLPALGDLAAGRHSVRVVKDGFFDWSTEAYVDPRETSIVWAELRERPERWYEAWWVWAIGGAAVLGGTATALLLTRPAPETSTVITTVP